jgi:hypothetical protein
MNKENQIFLKQYGIAIGSVAFLLVYPLARFGTEDIIYAAFAGCLVNVVNAVIGYAVIRFASRKPVREMQKVVLLSAVVRSIAVGIVAYHILVGGRAAQESFLVAFGLSFIASLVVEMSFMKRVSFDRAVQE